MVIPFVLKNHGNIIINGCFRNFNSLLLPLKYAEMILRIGDKPALCIGHKTVTYSKLIEKIFTFSHFINENQGRAIIFSENREGWIYAFFACWKQGIIPVPVDFLSVANDLKYIIEDCKPSIIFCSSVNKLIVNEAINNSGISPKIIIIDELELAEDGHSATNIEFGSDSKSTAVIIYTSGTTGKPKGVMLSYENLQANIDAVCTDIRIFTETDRVLMLLPLHHILPLLGTVIMPFSVGCSVAMSPSMISEDILNTLKNNKITIIIGVPRLYSSINKSIKDKISKSLIARMLFLMAKKVNSLRFSRIVFTSVQKKFGGNVKYMVSGGAALDRDVAKDLRILGFEILEGYGMTEAAPMISFTHPGKVKIGSAGFLLSCIQAEIKDNEIVVTGPNIMQGYYGKPDETKEVIKDGWLYTGDLGEFDDKGYIFVTGRKKEIIVLSNGKKINPVEIEERLESMHPLIKEAGVYYEEDRVKAIIIPDILKIKELQIEDIDNYIVQNILSKYNQSVAPYKMIMSMSVSEKELPRTRLGKIQRFMLPSLAKVKIKRDESLENVGLEEYNIIKAYIQEEKKLDIKPNHHLIMDLGFDSLERVGLQVFIETSFGVSIDMNKLISFENILQLSEYLHAHKKYTTLEKINWSHILKHRVHLNLPSSWITSNLIVNLSHLFFKIYFRFKGRGAFNIPKEPCIIASNHQSFFDGLFVASYLKFFQMRKTFFYAKEKHIRNPFLKFMANRNNIIIMDLNNNLKESIQKMAEVLRKNKNLIIFPEGTRTRDGNLGDFKKTFAILSRELNVPIVPVSIKGAYEALPPGSIFPKPFSRIMVEFQKPVYPGEHSYEGLSELVRGKIQKKLNA